MLIGNDGFTNCAFVCNPDNDMAWSCKEYCPEYKFVSTTLRTLTTQSLGNINTNENKDALIYLVLILCIATLLLSIIIIVCCLNKRRQRAFVNKCRNKRLQPPPTEVQSPVTDEEAELNTPAADEDERALLRIENENNNNSNTDRHQTDRPSPRKKTVNLPNASDLNSRSVSNVQALTHAVKHHGNQFQLMTEDKNHVWQHETELKEVGERADLVIGQNSSSFASSIVPIEPTTAVTVVTPDIERSYESRENANNDDPYAETGNDRSKQINGSIDSNGNNTAENDLDNNGEEADDDEEDDDDDDVDNDDDDDDNDDDDDADDDDDDVGLEEEDMMLINRRDHTNVDFTNDNGFTNKTENTLPTDIVPIITKSNFREL